MPLSESAQSSQFRPPSRDNQTENASVGGGGVVDSDTGGEGPNATAPKKKAKKKKTTNLGPCIRVHEVSHYSSDLVTRVITSIAEDSDVSFNDQRRLDQLASSIVDSFMFMFLL